MADLFVDLETVSSLPVDDKALLEMAGDGDPSSYGALCPALARIVCVGLYCSAKRSYAAIYDASLVDVDPDRLAASVDMGDGGVAAPIVLQSADGEPDLLVKFAAAMSTRSRLVTFNGRSFDIPVAVMRYATRGMRVPDLLLGAFREPRFKAGLKHRDLLEEMTCQGAARRFPLRAMAKAMGFADPKAGGDGGHVADLVAQRDGTALVRYCLGDVAALVAAEGRWTESTR